METVIQIICGFAGAIAAGPIISGFVYHTIAALRGGMYIDLSVGLPYKDKK
jgi:hypothetical protein